MDQLAADFSVKGKAEVYAALKVFLTGENPETSYAAQAEALGMTEGSVKVAVHRMRGRLRELLLREISHTLDSEESPEDELATLFRALAGDSRS